jgi:hypothetical protein
MGTSKTHHNKFAIFREMPNGLSETKPNGAERVRSTPLPNSLLHIAEQQTHDLRQARLSGSSVRLPIPAHQNLPSQKKASPASSSTLAQPAWTPFCDMTPTQIAPAAYRHPGESGKSYVPLNQLDDGGLKFQDRNFFTPDEARRAIRFSCDHTGHRTKRDHTGHTRNLSECIVRPDDAISMNTDDFDEQNHQAQLFDDIALNKPRDGPGFHGWREQLSDISSDW